MGVCCLLLHKQVHRTAASFFFVIFFSHFCCTTGQKSADGAITYSLLVTAPSTSSGCQQWGEKLWWHWLLPGFFVKMKQALGAFTAHTNVFRFFGSAAWEQHWAKTPKRCQYCSAHTSVPGVVCVYQLANYSQDVTHIWHFYSHKKQTCKILLLWAR